MPCQEQLAAQDTAFISIQAFPALLDLPQDLEVSAVSCGSRHTAVVTRECPAGQGTVPPGAGALRGARAHREPWGSALGGQGSSVGDGAHRVLPDGAVPVAGDGELYTWGWGKWHLCFGIVQPPLEQLLVPVLSSLALLSLYAFCLHWGLLCSLPPHKHQEQLPGEAPGPRCVMTVSAGKYGQLGHGNNTSSDQARRVEHLVAEGLRVEEVVCGPWTTYVRVREH